MTRAEDKTVLIAEDEPNVRIFLQTVLEDAGFKVLTAEDGEVAWKMIEEQKPDFISLDLVMPKISGRKLMRMIKSHEEYTKIPVLIVTAHADDELGEVDESEILQSIWRPKSLEQGPGVFLRKPVKPWDYVSSIANELGVEITDEVKSLFDTKDELENLSRRASPEALAAALGVLKKDWECK
ncbi:MAG: response regulator [Proteobacteria bacterium]|nr:response regulator [Pseudomonadota bacterium]